MIVPVYAIIFQIKAECRIPPTWFIRDVRDEKSAFTESVICCDKACTDPVIVPVRAYSDGKTRMIRGPLRVPDALVLKILIIRQPFADMLQGDIKGSRVMPIKVKKSGQIISNHIL